MNNSNKVACSYLTKNTHINSLNNLNDDLYNKSLANLRIGPNFKMSNELINNCNMKSPNITNNNLNIS